MATGKEDLLQSLIEAFVMEKGTREFYARASGKAAGYEAKSAFRKLSEWEEKHMDYILFLHSSIQGDRDLKSFEEFRRSTEAPVTESGIPVKDLEAKVLKHEFKSQMEALTLAMEIEGKACNLYRRMSEKAEDTNARIMFREMMQQEFKHVEYLKKLRVDLIEAY